MLGQGFPDCKTQEVLRKANAFTMKPNVLLVTEQAQSMTANPTVHTAVLSVKTGKVSAGENRICVETEPSIMQVSTVP